MGTMDDIGLYVNVQPESAAKEVVEEIIESEYTISHNIEECVKFVGVNMKRSEINEYKLLDVIPERKSQKAINPTMRGKEMNVRPSYFLK